MNVNMLSVYATSDKEKFPSYDPDTQRDRVDATFCADFLVCDLCYPGNEKKRIAAIKDTFSRCMDGWQDNYKYMIELEVVLNHLLWHYYDKEGETSDTAALYDNLWRKTQDKFYENFENDKTAIDLHFRVTD